MKANVVLIFVAAYVFLNVFGLVSLPAAESPQQYLNDVVRDTQKQGTKAGRVTLVWWMAPEFFRAALGAGGSLPVKQIEEMAGPIQDVNIFAVVDGKMGAVGQIDYVSAAEIQKNIELFDGENKPVSLIPEPKQTTATKNVLGMMKPVLTNMIGELGKNISFFVFEGKNKDGSRRIDPAKAGSLTIKLNSEEFRWRLPLGSLLPAKTCPKCNDKFPGNYVFCPYDATQLKVLMFGQ